MTAINHALTGAVIGFTVGNPVLAILLSFVSHFLLDVVPHYGSLMPADKYVASRQFKTLLGVDILLCVSLVIVLGVQQPHHWLLAAICAFVAALPDAIYMRDFIASFSGKKFGQKKSVLQRASMFIQWYERPLGAIVEVVWATAAIIVLKNYL